MYEDSMSDVPDLDTLEDEVYPPLPPPHSPGEGGAQTQGDPFGDAEEGDVSKLADVPAAKRKVVKRPQPKLDSQRLISERGLPALRTLFDNVRFKGKGHEAEDLQLLMQKMENWAHRLYPKLQFEDFVEKVEKLGSKKEVQTCLKRIRLDMPLTHEDFMDKEGVEEPPPDTRGFEDPDPFKASFSNSQGPIHSTPGPTVPTPAPPSLTEEQRMRMELNRQRALERRLARQQQTDPSGSQEVTASSSGNGPSSVSTATVLSGPAEQEEKLEEHLDPDPSSSTQTPTPSEPPTELPAPVPSELPDQPSAESTQGDAETRTTNELPDLSSSSAQEDNLEDLDLSTRTPPPIHPPPTEPSPPAEIPARSFAEFPDELPAESAEEEKENSLSSGPPLGTI